MPLMYQHRIYRQDLQKNPNVLYVFGDNLLRKGMGGQAAHMRGEPNAVGVATKKTPSMSEEAFYSDAEYDDLKKMFLKDVTPLVVALKQGKTVVWPSDGIGTGLSEVPKRAPKLWKMMETVRIHLEKTMLDKIDPFVHRCIIQSGPAEGNKYSHDVSAREVESFEKCEHCGEILATPDQIANHMYQQLMEKD